MFWSVVAMCGTAWAAYGDFVIGRPTVSASEIAKWRGTSASERACRVTMARAKAHLARRLIFEALVWDPGVYVPLEDAIRADPRRGQHWKHERRFKRTIQSACRETIDAMSEEPLLCHPECPGFLATEGLAFPDRVVACIHCRVERVSKITIEAIRTCGWPREAGSTQWGNPARSVRQWLEHEGDSDLVVYRASKGQLR